MRRNTIGALVASVGVGMLLAWWTSRTDGKKVPGPGVAVLDNLTDASRDASTGAVIHGSADVRDAGTTDAGAEAQADVVDAAQPRAEGRHVDKSSKQANVADPGASACRWVTTRSEIVNTWRVTCSCRTDLGAETLAFAGPDAALVEAARHHMENERGLSCR
jgi:hypothetical protein